MKSKKRMKYVLLLGTLLFAGVFTYQMMNAKKASGSFLPSSSMAHTESEAEFARRVSAATAKLRTQINSDPGYSHKPLLAPSAHAPHRQTSSDLAAMASAEISSFIANNI